MADPAPTPAPPTVAPTNNPPAAPAPAAAASVVAAAPRRSPIVPIIIALVVGAVLVLGYQRFSGLGGLLGDSKSAKPPAPPSEVVPNAPGPDNTITKAPPHPGVPDQPPSPIESQRDLSEKPKENK